jgi:hypothetical protein
MQKCGKMLKGEIIEPLFNLLRLFYARLFWAPVLDDIIKEGTVVKF